MTDETMISSRRRIAIPEVVIGVVLTIAFVWAFVTALDWRGLAAIFPLSVSGLGAPLAGSFTVRAFFPRAPRPSAPQRLPSLGDDDEDTDDDLDFVLSTASGRDWAIVLGYLAGFFAALYVLGLYPTAAVFTVLYLRQQARCSWRFSVIYAVVLVGLLYAVFGLALRLPVPSGIIPGIGG